MRALGPLPGPRSRAAGIVAASMLALSAAPSWAVLGGDMASIQADQARMRVMRLSASPTPGGSMHEMRLPDGSSIRQFVNAQGIVYAVAWSTRLKPDFAQLLGSHASEFNAGVSAAAQTPGLKRSAAVDRGDLVVRSAGRPGAFVGKAWLKSLLPAGIGSDAIR